MDKPTEEEKFKQNKGLFLVFFSKEIKVDFDLLRRHVEATEKFIEEESRRIIDNGDEEYDTFSMLRLGSHSYGHQEFIKTLRYGSFVSAVSLLESHFRMLVDLLPKKQKLKVDELSGQSLQKPFSYLSKVMGYDLISLENDLKELMLYYNFRNRIVHHLGNIPFDSTFDEHHQKGLYNFLKGFKSIEIYAHERVTIVDKSFILDFCNKAERFLANCHKILENDYLGRK